MHIESALLTRRAAIGRLGAGTLLALGLWPGALRADNQRPAGRFRFVVVNDTHVQSPECADYLLGAVRQMKQDSPEFCLHCGDVTDKGEYDHHDSLHRVFRELDAPVYPVIGNHDYLSATDCSGYTRRFPRRLNYHFRHGGWQFIGLDSSEGQRYEKTMIQPATLLWLDENLPRLNPRRPTVVFTHFPLGAGVNYRPYNAEEVLERFRDFNLQAIFSGHYHGFTERQSGQAILTTNRCCALKRNNHDGSKEKGYFVCEAAEGALTRRFVEFKPA